MRWHHGIAYGVAVAVGVLLALPDEDIDFGGPRPRPVIVEQIPATPHTVLSSAIAHASPPVAGVDAPTRVFGAMGITLEPYAEDGTFVGYAVVRSHDPRFNVGDVITAVNGEFVEHSAAGGELLIAQLRNADADVSVRPRSEWASVD